MTKKGLPPVFSCTSRASGAARSGAQRSASAMSCSRSVARERRQRDLLRLPLRPADGVKLAHQRMRGVNFVVAIGADQQQSAARPNGSEVLEQIERRRVEPLQIVKEQRQRMFGPGEDAEKAPEHQLEAALRLLRRKLRDRRLVADDAASVRERGRP